VAQPVTFTPYAASRPCSARCRFCSENLRVRDAGRAAAMLRPATNYFAHLARALDALAGLPLGYSLSGLEMTDDPAWFHELAAQLQRHAARSQVSETVLYTNGAGITDPAQRSDILAAVARLPSPTIEWSRHHFDTAANQQIMRIESANRASIAAHFEAAVLAAHGTVPVKLVCVVQSGGIDTAESVAHYLTWARSLGVDTVIFRELSALDDSYLPNGTSRYIAGARCAMTGLLSATLASFGDRFEADRATMGYYFWNLCGRVDGMNVVFEASDYARMHDRHRTHRVYKLVFHANGNLCAGWNPDRDVLLAPAAAP
jgi:hypothetical protein